MIRLEIAVGDTTQQRLETAFGLARENRNAEFARKVKVDRLAIEHRQAAGDVKAADGDVDAGSAERPGDVQRARILIGLHADQPDHAEAVMLAEAAQQLGDVDPRIGLVDHVDVDVDIRAEHATIGAVERDPVQSGQRIGR